MKESTIIPLLKFQNSNTNRELPFEIRTIQSQKQYAKEKEELPHSHDYFEMVWITNGTGTCWIDLQKSEIENNKVFCVQPGQVHQLQVNPHATGFVFSFTESFLNMGEHEFDWNCQSNFFQLFSGAPGISLREEMIPDMRELIGSMIKEFSNMFSFRTQILKRYLKIFLIYLTRQVEEDLQAAKRTRNMDLVQSFMGLLEKNFKEKKMVAEYAELLFVTPNYLNEIVKKNTGYSAGYHIRQRVVLEAKRLGRFSDTCMKEIAYSLGFSDSAHFSKFFKTVAGTNFSDFKRENVSMAWSS